MHALNLYASMCICVYVHLLEEAEPYFSLGSQNDTNSSKVKTTA